MPSAAIVLCFALGTFIPFLCQSPPKEPKDTWPYRELWLTTVVPFSRQQAHNVLADFEHQDKWYSGNKHQEMATPPPHRRIGAMRTMNMGAFPMFSGNDMVIWEEMVNLDDERFTWAYSIPEYNEDQEKHRGALPYSYKQRSDVTVYPITTNGNQAAVVEWNIKLRTMRTLETVIEGNTDTFITLFNDLADYLTKQNLPKEENTYYQVKEEKDKQVLVVHQGTLVEGSLPEVSAKLLSAHEKEKVTNVRKPEAGRENNFPTFFNVTYGEGHKGQRAVRPIAIPLGRPSFFDKILGHKPAAVQTYIHFVDHIVVTKPVQEHLDDLKVKFNSFLTGFQQKQPVQRTDL